jgi:hypothetical protein
VIFCASSAPVAPRVSASSTMLTTMIFVAVLRRIASLTPSIISVGSSDE